MSAARREGDAVALLIGAGWGVRTFLQSEALDRLRRRARVLVLAPPPLLEVLRRRYGDALELATLHPFDPWSGATGPVYRRYNAHFMRTAGTVTRRFKQRRDRPRAWRPRLAAALREAEAALRAGPARLRRLRAATQRAFAAGFEHAERYRELFARHGVRLAVSTVAYLPAEAAAALAARRAGIATACWVNSWDNLTSKGPLLADFDHYLVWSARMCQELDRYYPESAGRPCTVTGAPYFDGFSRDDYAWTRAELCRRTGLDPARPIVLYGTCTPFLAPDEHRIVERLADDLAALGPPSPQLLVRLHPADGGGRFGALAERPDVTLQVPGAARDGAPAGIAAFCPSDEENMLAINTVRHADAVINIASTLTLEAAIADRPAINVAYDLAPGAPSAPHIAAYYGFDHYRTVLEHGAATVARDPEALIALVRQALADPTAGREGRRALADLWCSPRRGGAGRRLGDALVSLLDRAAAPEDGS